LNIEAAALAWIEGWTRGWRDHDPEPIVAVYTEDAVFRSHPSRDAQTPREYALQAFGEEESATVPFGEPIAAGNRAAVEYWAIVRAEGKEWTLAGTTILRFADDGRASYHLDYWSMEEGRRDPPTGWGWG
jgi:ketosteroid isomerase-like protein